MSTIETAHQAPNGAPIVAEGLIWTAHDGAGAWAVFSDAEGAHVIGYVASAAAGWFASYLGGAQLIGAQDRTEALHFLALQQDAARYVARSIRAIRPAPEVGTDNAWDKGYNEALRQVEMLLTALTGAAPHGEGYTAITKGE